jgi:septum formation protein
LRIILASGSPRRKAFLDMLGLEFEVIPSRVDERAVKESDPYRLARKLAQLKAEDVAKGVEGEAVVIGADTLVNFQGRIIGKASDREHAVGTLRSYSGKEHEQVTGICLINTATGKVVVEHDVTRAKVRELTDKEIEGYVQTGEPLDGAGCYTPRAHPMLFSGIDGSWTNIVGLPMERFVILLGEVMREGAAVEECGV